MTGANVGLGLEAARHFARLGAAKVILACRNTDKGERAKADIERSTARSGIVEVWSLDLCSFESVKQFCQRADQLPRLDVVVENAAVAMIGPQAALAEGYESTITVNVVSTFLMALLLLPTLKRTATEFNVQPKLVIVSSDAHFMVRPIPVELRVSPHCSTRSADFCIRQALRSERHQKYSRPSSQPQWHLTGIRPPSFSKSSWSGSWHRRCPSPPVTARVSSSTP